MNDNDDKRKIIKFKKKITENKVAMSISFNRGIVKLEIEKSKIYLSPKGVLDLILILLTTLIMK